MAEDLREARSDHAEARCSNCGRTEAQHCYTFTIKRMPDKCKCNPREWGERVTPVCAKFFPDPDRISGTVCGDCEHDKECHDGC